MVASRTKKIEVPEKLEPLFLPKRGELRYRAAYGGRGSGKSFTFALLAAIWGAIEPLRILCTRELQNSIKESFHAELKNAIASDEWIASRYDVGVDYIRGKNGTEFVFKGLRHSISAIKSMAQIDLCIIEEAEDVPERAWVDLLPTVRSPKSEIWAIWNPRLEGSPVDTRLRKNTPPNAVVIEVNADDNPWFPEVLADQRKHDRETMPPELYAHIWEGAYYKHTEAQVFKGCYDVKEFKPGADWDGPYFGIDFGFAQDPTTAVKVWIYDKRIYIEHEAAKVGLELDHTADYIKRRVPDIESHISRADSARPESISYLKRHGLPKIRGVEKGKGSVEDGIEFMRSRGVTIHPRCTETIKEFLYYSYKVDRLTGDILPQVIDKHNHLVDGARYAIAPLIKKRAGVYIG